MTGIYQEGSSVWNKQATDLQSGITINGNRISGTLNYVTNYGAFGGDEKNGNFIALRVNRPAGSTVKAKVVGGTHGEMTVDSDNLIVARITATTQKIKLTATLDNTPSYSVEYDLSGLILNAE